MGALRGDLAALMRDQLALYGDPATRGLLSGLVAQMHRSPRLAALIRQGSMLSGAPRWSRSSRAPAAAAR